MLVFRDVGLRSVLMGSSITCFLPNHMTMSDLEVKRQTKCVEGGHVLKEKMPHQVC